MKKRITAVIVSLAALAIPAVASAHIVTRGPLVHRVKVAYHHSHGQPWFKVKGTKGLWLCSKLGAGEPVACEHATKRVYVKALHESVLVPGGIALAFGPLK